MNIMDLADAYADSLAELENENWVHGTVGGGSVELVDIARAALEAAVTALEEDAARYHTVLGMSSDQMLRLYNKRIDLREQFIDNAMEAK